MPDATINLDLVLLEAAVWGGACAGLAAFWRMRLLRRAAIVQASILAALATVVLVGSLSAGGTVAHVPLGTWLGFRSSKTPLLELAHCIGPTEAVLLLGVSLAVLLTAGACRARGDGRDDVGRFCLFQAGLQFVLFGDPVIKIAFLALMSAACLFWGNAESDAAEVGVTARRRFLFRLAAHGLLVLAWVGAGDALRWGNDSLREAADWLLPLGVLAHVLAYPFFGSVGDVEGRSESVMLDRVLLTPAVLLLVPASWLAGVHPVMLLSGAYVALMAGVTAAGRWSSRPEGIMLAAAGMMLAAVAVGSDLALQAAALLFVASAVTTPILAAAGGVAGLRWGAALPLGTGIGGAALGIAALVRLWKEAPGIDDAIVPFLALVLIGAAQLLVAFGLGRRMRVAERYRERKPIDVSPSPESSPWFAVAATVSLVLLAAVAFALHGVSIRDGQRRFAIPEFLPVLSCGLLGTVAIAIGWMIPASKPAAESRGRKGPELADLFVLMVVLPLRAGAQLCRLFEWFIIERLWELPRQVPRLLRHLGEPLQSQSARTSVLTILLATGALLGVILGLGN
ncbi:MAG: hypothetical protein ACE5KM_12005 [Planctomycetaceae bacterium]